MTGYAGRRRPVEVRQPWCRNVLAKELLCTNPEHYPRPDGLRDQRRGPGWRPLRPAGCPAVVGRLQPGDLVPAPSEQPGDERVGVPHVSGAEVVPAPRRAREVRAPAAPPAPRPPHRDRAPGSPTPVPSRSRTRRRRAGPSAPRGRAAATARSGSQRDPGELDARRPAVLVQHGDAGDHDPSSS